MIFRILLCAFVIIAGCRQQLPEKSRWSPTIVEASKTIKPPRKLYEELAEQWQKEQKTQSRPANHSYDFNSDKAQALRSLIHEQKFLPELKRGISLDLFICLAYERNPGLKKMRREVEKIEKRYGQNMFLQDIVGQYIAFTQVSGKQDKQYPMPGLSAWMGKIIATERRLAQMRYFAAMRDIIFQITYDYREHHYLEQAIKIHREHLKILQAFENITREKFKANRTAYSNVLKAQIARHRIETTLTVIIKQKEKVTGQLLYQVDLPGEIPVGPCLQKEKQPKEIEFSTLGSLAEKRWEIEIARLEQQKSEQWTQLAERKLYPNFGSGFSFTDRKRNFSDKIKNKISPWFGSRESYIEEMRVKTLALEQQVKDWQQRTKSELKETHWQLTRALEYSKLYREQLLPLARENLKVTRTSYSSTGEKIDFSDVLDAESRLLDYQLALYKSKRDYWQKWALLEKITGNVLKN